MSQSSKQQVLGHAWQQLGSGVHAVVWRARTSNSATAPADLPLDPLDDLPNWIAVKVVFDNRSMPPHDIVREAVLLKRCSHHNIISCLDFIRDGPSAPYALYMPIIPLRLTILLNSPLFSSVPLTGPYSALAPRVLASASASSIEPFMVVVKSIVFQLILAVAYLHSLDPPIAHRDINPGNILIDRDGTVKLIDFGIAWEGAPSSLPADQSLSSANYMSRDWKETPDDMCSQVATGPHRAPELLFSPRTYLATAVDSWSLGTTISQFFTPLKLIPSGSPLSSSPSPTLSNDDDESVVSSPFIIPPSLKKNIDFRATWERYTLFNGERGELGLAWSIFSLRGTPNDETWPTFNALPDVSKIQFRIATAKPLRSALPHLPPPPAEGSDTVASLIDKFLVYTPSDRLTPAQALSHSWFSKDLLLPRTVVDLSESSSLHGHTPVTVLEGRNLASWLEPALKREGNRITRFE